MAETLTWSEERLADAGRGIELCWQELGDLGDPPLVLVMGIGSQMIAWPDGLCERLAAGGFRVIRFDNRDCGRSTWLTELGVPSVTKAWQRELENPPYLLSDMAADIAGLLDALELSSAHIVGASLGGFIAQTLAFEQPDRVLSLASIMSSTGSGQVGYPTEAAMGVLMSRPPDDPEGLAEWTLEARRVIGSPAFEHDTEWIRATAIRSHARGLNPDGTQRQLVASICSGNRTDRLAVIAAPTVVIHGTEDPLIDVSGGVATAEAIPDAELVLIEGMGHDLPPGVWDRVADTVAGNARRSEES